MKEIPVSEREVTNKMYGSLLSSDAREVVESGEKLLKEYPHSIYLPVIYHWLTYGLSRSKNLTERSDSLIRSALELISKCRTSRWSRTGIFDYINGYNNEIGLARNAKYSREQAERLKIRLLDIKARHQSELLSRYVDEAIQRVARETEK
jgi:hypothetical protein